MDIQQVTRRDKYGTRCLCRWVSRCRVVLRLRLGLRASIHAADSQQSLLLIEIETMNKQLAIRAGKAGLLLLTMAAMAFAAGEAEAGLDAVKASVLTFIGLCIAAGFALLGAPRWLRTSPWA